jgi:hypothetical protein
MTRYSITLDLSKYTTQLSVPCKNTDVGREIAITLHQNGVPYTLTADNYAVFVAKNSSGADIVNDCVVDLVNNCVVYKITPQTIANGGNIPCEIQLFGYDREQIGSPTFNILVRKSILGETDIESSDEYGILNAIINDIRRSLEAGEFDGKSAYQYAVEYGYEGSEEEFGAILAELKTYKEYTDQHLLDHDEAIAELQGDNEQLYMIADELVAMNETTAKRVDFCEKRITNLEKGLPADRFVTDDTVAYVKRIPTNACPFAAVEKVGGMTYRDGDTLMPTKVTAIESKDANGSVIGRIEIPEEVQSIEGYGEGAGTASNAIVWNEDGIAFEKRCKKITLTNDMAIYRDTYAPNFRFGFAISDKVPSVGFVGNMVSNIAVLADPITTPTTAKEYSIAGSNSGGAVYVIIPNITYAADAIAYLNAHPIELWYETTNHESTDISDLITADNLIEVEGGGTLTFVNEYGAVASSTIEYQVKEAS